MGRSSETWIIQWQVVVMTQVRTRVGCKEPRRYNGSACHNSVAEGKFLSHMASGQTE